MLRRNRRLLIDLESEIEVGKRKELCSAAEREGGAANDLGYRLLGCGSLGEGADAKCGGCDQICRSLHDGHHLA
jgi:hypothetical protein